jgi:hypothetical protein
MEKNEINRNKLTAAEIRKYKAMLLAKMNEILGNVTTMETEALRRERSDLSNMPIHMADLGTDSYEIDNIIGLMDSERCARSHRRRHIRGLSGSRRADPQGKTQGNPLGQILRGLRNAHRKRSSGEKETPGVLRSVPRRFGRRGLGSEHLIYPANLFIRNPAEDR